MNVFTTSSRIIVTCSKRMAPFLEQEVRALGFEIVRLFMTGIELRGTLKDTIRLNLNLRAASQVLYSLKEFKANNPEDLYANIVAIPWESIITDDGYFSVSSNVDHPSIRTSMFANVKVKDAIVDRMREKTGRRPDSGSTQDRSMIHLFWKDNTAELFIDSSGETLAKHGYRKIPGQAPMLESLAAATLLATKWDRQSPFINPMCGSGTLAIEAVLLATKRSPGLFRNNYSFMHITGYQDEYYDEERQKLEEQVIDVPGLVVVASDISEDAIGISKINAGIAGVEQYIRFEVCDFADTPIPENGGGVVFFNPEYGERLGALIELGATYARIGDFMKKNCRGYTGYIFTGNLDFAKKIGLKASRRIEFYTGKINCRLLEYELYAGSRE